MNTANVVWGMVPTGRYDNLLRRQQADLAVFASDEAIDISPEINYEYVQGLSSEIKERLKKIRPANIVSPLLPVRFVGS